MRVTAVCTWACAAVGEGGCWLCGVFPVSATLKVAVCGTEGDSSASGLHENGRLLMREVCCGPYKHDEGCFKRVVAAHHEEVGLELLVSIKSYCFSFL
jgi:hypothetical protein